MLDVAAGDVESHFGILGHHNWIGIESPCLRNNVRFILAGSKLAHARVGKGTARCVQCVGVHAATHAGHLDVVGHRSNRDRDHEDDQQHDADAHPNSFPPLHMQADFLSRLRRRTVFAHCVTPRESMST